MDIKQLEEKINLNPKEANPEDVYKVANYYFNNQLLDEALKYYQLLLELNPNHKMGLFELGGIYSNLGNLEEAIKCWQKIISIDPHFTRAHFNLALAYSKLKKYAEALSELQITLSLVRQSGDPIGLEKRILQEIQRIQNLQTNINPSLIEDIDTQKQYALILLKKGDFNNALNAFKDVIKLKPDDIESLLNIGIILYRNKEFSEAIEYLNKVIELNEDNADAYFYLGSCYEELKNLDKAIYYFKIAVNKNPNNYFWYYKLAKILYNLGNYEESIKYFRVALDLNPLDSYTHNNLGVALLDAGNINEAIKHFLRAVYLDPNDSYSYYNLARCYLKVGQLSRALKNILKAINLESNKAIYYLEAAKIYYKLRNYKDSLNYAIKASELDPNLQDAFLLISKLYIIAKKYDEAINILNKFIEEEKFEHYLELVNIYLLKENRGSQDLRNALNILYKLYSNKDFINQKKYKGIFLEVLRKIILINYELSNYEEAYKFIPEFIENLDNSISSYLIIIKTLFKLGKYKEIVSLIGNLNLSNILGDIKSNENVSFKDKKELLYIYTISLIKTGENENYIQYFKLASEIISKLYLSDPNNKEFIYYYAYVLSKLSNYSKAFELINSIENEIISNFNNYFNSIEFYFSLLYNLNNHEELVEKAFYFINNVKDLNNQQLGIILKYLIITLSKKQDYLKIYNLTSYYKYFSFSTIYYSLDTLFILKYYYYIFDLNINEINKKIEEIINNIIENFDNYLLNLKKFFLDLNFEEVYYFNNSFIFVLYYLFSSNKNDLFFSLINNLIKFLSYLFNIDFYELIFNMKEENFNFVLGNIIKKIIDERAIHIIDNIDNQEIIKNSFTIINNFYNLNDILISIIKVILYYSIYQSDIKSIKAILNKYGKYFITELVISSIKLSIDISDELLNQIKDYKKSFIDDLFFDIYLNIDRIKKKEVEIIFEISKKLLDFDIKEWIRKIYLLPSYLIDVNLEDLRVFFLNLLTFDFDNYIINERWDKIKLFINSQKNQINIKNEKVLEIIEKLLNKINEELYNEKNRYYILFITSKFKLATGNIEETITLLSQSINYNLFFYESRLYLGCIYILRDMYDLALEQFLELSNYYEDELLLFLLGKSYLLSKYLKLAKEVFDKLLKINPNNNLYIYHNCLIEIYLGNINAYELMEKRFLKLYKDILFSNTKSNLYYEAVEFAINLVNIYILIKKYDNAINILTKLIEENVIREEIYKYLAIIYLATNQVVKALNVYNLGIKNIPDSSELYSNRGVLYYKANKLDLAENDFLKAYELNKFDFVAKSHLGFINLKKGNYEESIKYFKEALIIKPFSADVYMSIGTVYEKINKLIEARDNYEMAYEYNPNNPIIIKKLIEIYKKLKDKNRIEIIKEDIEKNPNLDINIKTEIINYINS